MGKSMAIQPPYLKQPSHVAKATLTCGLYPATRVSPNMWLSSHQMYLKFNREINRKINREINRNLSVFQGKMLFKNQSEIQSLNFQRKQNLLKKSCFQSKIDFAKKSIVLLIFFNRGAFGLEYREHKPADLGVPYLPKAPKVKDPFHRPVNLAKPTWHETGSTTQEESGAFAGQE